MSNHIPSILILGHSFVRRLRDDLNAHFDVRAAPNFHLPESGYVSLMGTGGRTVKKLRKHDLPSVRHLRPDIVILEIGTNDLSLEPPEVVGSNIDDLARLLRDEYKVRVVVVCQVLDRNLPNSHDSNKDFNVKASLLRKYLSVVLSDAVGIVLWEHRDFSRSDRVLLSPDGVHVNEQGQYCLYRSYRGAILNALHIL